MVIHSIDFTYAVSEKAAHSAALKFVAGENRPLASMLGDQGMNLKVDGCTITFYSIMSAAKTLYAQGLHISYPSIKLHFKKSMVSQV